MRLWRRRASKSRSKRQRGSPLARRWRRLLKSSLRARPPKCRRWPRTWVLQMPRGVRDARRRRPSACAKARPEAPGSNPCAYEASPTESASPRWAASRQPSGLTKALASALSNSAASAPKQPRPVGDRSWAASTLSSAWGKAIVATRSHSAQAPLRATHARKVPPPLEDHLEQAAKGA